MERLSTGVDGLDALIRGYPKGRTILVSGESGAGKTIFGLQFLNACCKSGMTCVYITTEERLEDLKAQAMSFGWNLDEYVHRGLLRIIDALERRMSKMEDAVTHGVEKPYKSIIRILSDIYEEKLVRILPNSDIHKGKRAIPDVVIIDNIGVLAIGIPTPELREQLDTLVFQLVVLGCTSLIICDEAVVKMSEDIMMYSVYGAIRLKKRDNPYINKRERVMDIVKMRNTKIPLDYLLFDITDKGIELITKS